MAIGVVASNVAAGIVPIIAKELVISNLFPKLDVLQFVRQDVSDTTAGIKGKVIQVPRIGTMSVNYKSDNTPVVYQVPQDSMETVTLSQRPYVAIPFEDTSRVFTDIDYIMLYIKDAVKTVYQAAIADTFASVTGYATPARFSATIGTAGTAVNRAIIQQARLQLNKSFAPEEDRTLLLAETSDDALLSDSAIYQAYQLGQAIIPTGKLPNLYGMPSYWTTLVPTVTGTPNARWNMALHKDAIAFVSRPLPMEDASQGVETVIMNMNGLYVRISKHYDGDNQQLKFVVDALYGVNVIRPEFLCVIKS